MLKDFMDHASAVTTQGYYKITLKRKRDAVAKLSAHVTDRRGDAVPPRPPISCGPGGALRRLPATEQHINDMRADRETATAMDAAGLDRPYEPVRCRGGRNYEPMASAASHQSSVRERIDHG